MVIETQADDLQRLVERDELRIPDTFTCSACKTGPWHNSWSPEFNPPLCPNCSGAD